MKLAGPDRRAALAATGRPPSCSITPLSGIDDLEALKQALPTLRPPGQLAAAGLCKAPSTADDFTMPTGRDRPIQIGHRQRTFPEAFRFKDTAEPCPLLEIEADSNQPAPSLCALVGSGHNSMLFQ